MSRLTTEEQIHASLRATESLGMEQQRFAELVEQSQSPEAKQLRADEILYQAADLYRERDLVYGSNFNKVAAVLESMFPDGVTIRNADEFRRWHNFELIVVKMCRFAQSGLTHMDSIRDSCVYCAIVDSVTTPDSQPIGATKQ